MKNGNECACSNPTKAHRRKRRIGADLVLATVFAASLVTMPVRNVIAGETAPEPLCSQEAQSVALTLDDDDSDAAGTDSTWTDCCGGDDTPTIFCLATNNGYGGFTISLDVETGTYDWTMTDESGGSWSGTLPADDGSYSVDLSDLAPGIYTVDVALQDGGQAAARFARPLAAAETGQTSHLELKAAMTKVEIADSSGNPITAKLTRSVGQQVKLQAKVTPSGLSGLTYKWTIQGTTVKDYVIASDQKTATKTDLGASDLAGNTIQFYWVDGGAGRTVKLEVTKDATTHPATITVDVERPTVISFTSKTGVVGVDNTTWGSWQLFFGTPTVPGIEWVAKISPSANYVGKVKATQVLQENFQATRAADGSTVSEVVPTMWLDASDPYNGLPPGDLAAGGVTIKTSNDSPAQPLSQGFKKFNVKSNKYDLFLMFKPTTTDAAIWVPLQKLSWGWSGVADSTDGGTHWSKTSGGPDSTDPGGSDTVAFPQWPDIATETNPPWKEDPK